MLVRAWYSKNLSPMEITLFVLRAPYLEYANKLTYTIRIIELIVISSMTFIRGIKDLIGNSNSSVIFISSVSYVFSLLTKFIYNVFQNLNYYEKVKVSRNVFISCVLAHN